MQSLAAFAIAAYAGAAALYLGVHVGRHPRIARMGRALLAAAWGVHLIEIAFRCVQGHHPASSAAEAMGFIAWLIAGGYLAASLKYRLDAGGAFAVPATLVLLLLARVVPVPSLLGGPPGPVKMETLGVVHVLLATLGVAAFALATALEALYLVQERRLKRKEFGRLKSAGISLDTLDALAARCVSFGFPVFTLAIITGAIWVARLGVVAGHGAVRPEYWIATASWVAFGVLLVARRGAGWQGRRAAWLTLGGFAGVLLVAFGYLVRAV